MRRPRSSTRCRACIAILTTATMLFTLAQAPAASAGKARKLVRIVNRARVNHDLRPLTLDRRLIPPARKHTNRMIRDNEIYDPPNLARIMSNFDHDDLGADVVGCGHTMLELHRVLMTDSYHRMIILHEDLRRIGIAVVRNDGNNRCGRGSYWATELFYG